MSQKAIREFDGKRMLCEWMNVEKRCVHVGPDTDLEKVPISEPWVETSKLVVKPDQLIKRRGKSGLLALNLSWQETKDWLHEHRGKDVQVGNTRGVLQTFIIEPFLPHTPQDEYYICIQSTRMGDEILFHHEGGVDVGDVDAKAVRMFIPITRNPVLENITQELLGQVPLERQQCLAQYISSLFQFFSTLHYTYLEINPLVVTGSGDNCVVTPLDLAAKVDETAHFECQDQWGPLTFPAPFGASSSPEEEYIASLDNKTGASLKLTILNPAGRVWTLVAGGGASVIYADTIVDLGYAHELANYGEYSGAPNESMTYSYAKTVLDLITRNVHPEGKVLLIGGGIANFTNVAETFKGIIRALKEYRDKLRAGNVKIFVRRAGPNYQEGLKMMRETGENLGLEIRVYGPETHMTAIVAMALGKERKEEETSPILAPSTEADPAAALRGQSPVLSPAGSFTLPTKPASPTVYHGVFTHKSKAIVFGMQPGAVQNMLDSDFICRRETPSVSSIVYTFASGVHYRQFYWGDKEITIPVYPSLHQALQKQADIDVVVNFASARSAYESTLQMLQYPQIRCIAIIAEGVPEKHTRHLVSQAKQHGVTIIGPATVGGLKPGAFRIGNAGGMLDNLIASKLYRPGSVAYVSRSGGLSNELNNIISRTTDGVCEGIAIGGDRYPVSTFLDNLLRYQHDPNVKMMVLLGEVGGTLEYEVVEALKDGRLTKPLVAWCTGTCAAAFSYDVQFGHAGALAQSTLETAAAKNKALKEAGAIVPDSFDDYAVAIRDTYKKLVADGTLVPRPDIAPPQVPVDYHWARKLGLIRKPTLFTSSICDERGEEVCYSGVPMTKIFEDDMGIGGSLGLLWFRRKLPNYACKFIEMVLTVTADHGPAVSGAHNTIVTTRAGKDLVSSLCSGLLTIGPRFGGALDEAASKFAWAFDKGLTPTEFVTHMRDVEKQFISGIGHKVKSIDNPDKRVTFIVKYAKDNFQSTALLDYALEVEKITTRKKGSLILNVDGAIACAFVDMMRSCGLFTQEEVQEYIDMGALNGLFVLGRSVGFIGHFLDQKRLKQPLYRQPVEDISYISDNAL